MDIRKYRNILVQGVNEFWEFTKGDENPVLVSEFF